jgi:hypothetical protein
LVGDPVATLDAVERMIERDARGDRYAFVAREQPHEVWSERRFRRHALQLVHDESVPVDGRRALLHVVVTRMAAVEAVPDLRRIAASDSALRTDAIATLLLFDPRAALDLAEPSIVGLEIAADALRALFERTELPRADLDRFATEELFRLGCILARHVTFEDPRPAGQVYSPTDEMKLYELRGAILERLVRRPDFEGLDLLCGCIADPPQGLECADGCSRCATPTRSGSCSRRCIARWPLPMLCACWTHWTAPVPCGSAPSQTCTNS